VLGLWDCGTIGFWGGAIQVGRLAYLHPVKISSLGDEEHNEKRRTI